MIKFEGYFLKKKNRAREKQPIFVMKNKVDSRMRVQLIPSPVDHC